jgi:fluoride ion exporter CrcB/FEX
LRFPLATVIVNIVGCCVIGVLAGLVAAGRLPMRTNWREFVFVGIVGAAVHFGLVAVERFGVMTR